MSHPALREAMRRRLLPWLLAVLWLPAAPASAASLTFTVNTSEPVSVTGAPRLAIDVGGVARQAAYSAGSGTNALTFSYPVQAGDFDANGIGIASPLELDGGTIADLAGNPLSSPGFTLPNTSAIKVQTYAAAFATDPITNANANAVSFTVSKAPTGASFTYAITSSGGSGSVTGSGTISGSTQTVSGVDVSALPAGTLTLSVTVTTPAGGTGAARTATTTPGFTGVLDGLSPPAAAFSIRRLGSAYGGPLVRVLRSSDSSGQNIGATVAGNLNLAALASFCGASSCIVRTLYDQSGNGKDATNTTTSLLPRIVNAGATETEGGRPALRFTGVADQRLAAPAVSGQTGGWAFNVVARSTDSTVKNRHVLGDRGSGMTGRVLRANLGGGSFTALNVGGGTVTMAGSTTQQRVVTATYESSALSGTLDGQLSAGQTNSYYQPSLLNLWIGSGGAGQSIGAVEWIGTISEVLVFEAALSTPDRQKLERNQGAYFGIAVP